MGYTRGYRTGISILARFFMPVAIITMAVFLSVLNWPGKALAASSYTLLDDATGGDCALIGSWSAGTKTCTLTTDIAAPADGITIGADGIVLDGAGHSLTGNNVGDGVLISGRNNVTVRDLKVAGFNGMGISIFLSGNVQVTGNEASGNALQGIYAGSSNGIIISGNLSHSNYGGISLWQTTGSTVSGNATYSNTLQGVWLSEAGSNAVQGNQASRNGEAGILLDPSSHNNTIATNQAQSNSLYGIRAYLSDGNVISNNTFSGNGYAGLAFNSCNGNQVYGNSFIGNGFINPSGYQAISQGNGNLFNLAAPAGGNYWHDWTAPDSNGDGFVDAAYVFDTAQDDLPVTQPFTCGVPALGMGGTSPHWASYADYQARVLSVDYALGNSGPDAYSVSIAGATCSNGVALIQDVPAAVDIQTGAAVNISLRYFVPVGVMNFSTTTYTTARDVCGGLHEYPGPMPGA